MRGPARILLLILSSALLLSSCSAPKAGTPETETATEAGILRPEDDPSVMMPKHGYTLEGSSEVGGRQGVAVSGDFIIVSGSKCLIRYDSDMNEIVRNDDPFEGLERDGNHLGDIDVCDGEIYAGVEFFEDGIGKDIQLAVYDAETLELERTFPFEPESGQTECSGIAVDPERGSVYMCSWVGEESGRYLYEYDLTTGSYKGKIHLQMPPQWIQGIACHEGDIYITADDGNADDDECDHLYRATLIEGQSFATVTLERTFDDVKMQGEIEGLSFDAKNGKLLLLYNRGAVIILGMPSGFYPGYDREISEVYTYSIK